MRKNYILAYDLGTTGTKAVLVHYDRGIIQTFFVPYKTRYPAPTWAEQDPNDWWRAVVLSTQGLLQNAKLSADKIACVVFSGQMMGCVPLSRDGTPLRDAIIWADQRAVNQAGRLLEKVGLEQAYRITGHRIGPAYSAPKMMWLKEHEPHVFRQVYKFLQAKDFIVYKLTETWVTDPSDASGTGLFDIKTLTWSEILVEAAGIPPELLPEVRPSVDVVGEVTYKAAQETGLFPGTPVVIGGGDGVCATAGAGVVQPGIGHVYLGSSAWVAGASVEPLFDPKMRTFTWPHLSPQLYSPNGTMHNAGSSLEWASEILCTLEKKIAEWLELNLYDLVEQRAERVRPGSEGLLFLPYLMGERSPLWNPNARGVFLGLTRKHGPAHLLRSVYEGVALNLRTIFLALQEVGANFSAMRVIGGGAMSRLWPRILADVLGVSLQITAAPLEATSIGAAMAGAVGVGLAPSLEVAAGRFVTIRETVEPGPAKVFYEHLHKVFVEAYAVLTDIFERLVLLEGKI